MEYQTERFKYFECKKNGHNKFWAIVPTILSDKRFSWTVRYGRIDTIGTLRHHTKSYLSKYLRDDKIFDVIYSKEIKGYKKTDSPKWLKNNLTVQLINSKKKSMKKKKSELNINNPPLGINKGIPTSSSNKLVSKSKKQEISIEPRFRNIELD